MINMGNKILLWGKGTAGAERVQADGQGFVSWPFDQQ